MTLARGFGQALPMLEGLPTSYSHEFRAELLFDLCAALVREGLGTPEAWHKCGENPLVFAQQSMVAAIGEDRWNLLQRNVEYHLQIPQRRQMFYQNSEGLLATLNGKTFPQPALVWRVEEGDLTIRALSGPKRPEAQTRLAVAPFWNLSADGRVCTGSMRRPEGASIASIAAWEQGFYESGFTHANVGRLTRHEAGFGGLWTGLADKRKSFPVESLIHLPQTLAQFVSGERG